MKTSPLQLKWVTYPTVSYETVEDFESERNPAIPAEVEADVSYSLQGDHLAFLKISNEGESAISVPYRFSVTVVAAFSFDLEIARREYNPKAASGLPPILAVNVARILYAGAREQLAMVTARAPHGPAMLDSVMLEPSDVTIRSPGAEPEVVLRHVFGATDEEMDVVRARVAARAAAASTDVPARKKRKSASQEQPVQ
jgi:preprotein translocase subunit SecB